MHSSAEEDSDNSATTATASTEWTFSAKSHAPSSDPSWDAIQRCGGATRALGDLRFVQRVGSGDIGSV